MKHSSCDVSYLWFKFSVLLVYEKLCHVLEDDNVHLIISSNLCVSSSIAVPPEDENTISLTQCNFDSDIVGR